MMALNHSNVTRWRESLHGDKVILRPFCPSDITSIYVGWLNNPEVVRFSNQRFQRHSAESSRQYLSTFIGSDNLFLGICDPETHKMVGTLTVYRNVHHRTADIGIMVGDIATWGKGLGFDAFQTVTRALASCGEVRKMTAGALAANVGMVRIMQKAGFEWEATREGQELIEGQPVDLVYYSKFCHA
jgi:RimJ/RimL family protein N-acetyltransferase